MRIAIWMALALPLLGVPLAGCGGDTEQRDARGLAPPDETNVPESEKAMKETEAQRQETIEKDEEATEQKEFNEGGGQR